MEKLYFQSSSKSAPAGESVNHDVKRGVPIEHVCNGVLQSIP